MRVYIAGPMRGYDNWNHQAFNEAEDRWRGMGWDVFNPARLAQYLGMDFDRMVEEFTFEDYMAHELPEVVRSDAIAMLKDWQGSQGARTEHAVAREMGKRVFHAYYPAPLPVTDHPYTEGSWSAGETTQCCDRPDYMHLPLWRHS